MNARELDTKFDAWWHREMPNHVSGDEADDRAVAKAAWDAAYDALIADTRAGEGVDYWRAMYEYAITLFDASSEDDAGIAGVAFSAQAPVEQWKDKTAGEIADLLCKDAIDLPQPAQGGQGQQSIDPDAPVSSYILDECREWASNRGHGENCYLSDHYEGDPGNQCNCGLDGLLADIESAQSQTPPIEQGRRREVTDSDVECAHLAYYRRLDIGGTTKRDAMHSALERYESTRAPQPHGLSPPDFDGSHVGIEDRPDMWPDWVHRVVDRASEEQPHGASEGSDAK